MSKGAARRRAGYYPGMGHHIVALVIPGVADAGAAAAYDLRPIPLAGGVTLLHVDHYYSAYWQAKLGGEGELEGPEGAPGLFPREAVLVRIAGALTRSARPRFAIVMTDYFGGFGYQWAAAYAGARQLEGDGTINAALRDLGVVRRAGMDEFDTVGLGDHRWPPDYLRRYSALCDELGI